jgi:hypothetical protein
MSLNFVRFDFQRSPNDNIDINKVVVSKPKKKQMSKPAKTKVKI